MEEQADSTTSPRRSSVSSASSPEFSFWPSSLNPNPKTNTSISSADDLFSNGILLPTIKPESVNETQPNPIENPSSILSPTPTNSKRWKDIFKMGDKIQKEKSKTTQNEEPKNRIFKHQKPGSVTSTEISINIWPFGRSRSAGTAGSCRKPTGVSPLRKSSSAPCSRSNSRGENKPGSVRRWAASPGRPGVHVGRTSPVWQIKRNGGTLNGNNKPVEPVGSNGSNRVINLGVNSCIGYRSKDLRCGGEPKDRVAGGDRNGLGLFGIKGLFSKKVH